jgi:hypothetical protein
MPPPNTAPKPIATRWAEPTHDSCCGAGHADTAREQLDAVRDLAITVPSNDPYSSSVAAVIAAHNAIESCRRLLWSVADSHATQMAAASGFLRGATESAGDVAVAGLSPGDGQAGVAAARAGAARQVTAGVSSQIAREVVTEVAKQAADASAAAQAAMSALASASQSATDDWFGPRSLSTSGGTFDVGRAHRVGVLEHELRAEPVQSWRDRYERLMARNETDKLDLLDETLPALIREIKDTPPAKLVTRLQIGNYPRADATSAMRDVAFALDDMIKQRRKATAPASLDVIARALAMLSAIFFALIGTNVALLSGPEFRRRFLANGNPSGTEPFGVSPDWVSRRIGPSGSPPPGWSPRAAVTRLGAVIREPREV